MKRATRPIEMRFWHRVDRGANSDECWLWKGCTNSQGYGCVNVDATHRAALTHRVAFFLTHGYWPNVARHSCDNPPCCNPSHILDGTRTDNARDRDSRGRTSRGTSRWNAKLNPAAADEIRAARGRVPQKVLAHRYGVAVSSVSHIQHHKVWK